MYYAVFKTRLTSVLNGLKTASQLYLRIGEVTLKIGSVSTVKSKVKVYANQEKSLSHPLIFVQISDHT